MSNQNNIRFSTTMCTSLILAGLIVIAASTMMTVAQRVEKLRDQQASLTKDIERERRALHMPHAEWAHLNQPERLRDLALAVTDLRPLEPAQLVSVTSLAETLEEIEHTPTAPHCAGLEPPARKPTVDSNGILLVTYGLGGDPI